MIKTKNKIHKGRAAIEFYYHITSVSPSNVNDGDDTGPHSPYMIIDIIVRFCAIKYALPHYRALFFAIVTSKFTDTCD